MNECDKLVEVCSNIVEDIISKTNMNADFSARQIVDDIYQRTKISCHEYQFLVESILLGIAKSKPDNNRLEILKSNELSDMDSRKWGK